MAEPGVGERERDARKDAGDFHPARSPWTWLLALVLVACIDAAITRTSLLWGPTAFENSGELRLVFPQTYQVARKIYAPEGEPAVRVALLGNSRVQLALKEHRLERALAALRPEREARVSNLGIFGAFMAETEMVARHLDALDPSLVVLAVGAPDLVREPTHPAGQGPMDLLRIGFRDGAWTESSWTERVDRWLRTVFPLYRFREFAREAILDRVLGRRDPGPPPQEFASRAALFTHLYGERAPEVGGAFASWQREGGLDAYARYLEVASPGHFARGKARAREGLRVTGETRGVRILDALLERLARSGRPVLLLLMPENPILAQDLEGTYHTRGLADEAAALARESAAAHGVPVVDARGWLATDRFLDFDHPIFQLEALEDGLAREVLRAIEP